MRPQQQNRRMRGRNNSGGNNNNNNNNNNNSNRKGPNPLTRNYESNGPDVKIRGSAQQIAEKYAQLARDAHSSGDRVMAENYLQHAEHYNRIIAAAQAQMPIQNVQQTRDMSDDDMEDERDEFDNFSGNSQQNHGNANGNQSNGNGNGYNSNAGGNNEQPQQANLGSGPQPVIEGVPAELALDQQRQEGRPRRERNERFDRNDRRDRNDRGERNRPADADAVPPVVAEPAPVAEVAAAPVAVDEEAPAAPRRGRKPRRPVEADAGTDADSDVGLAQTLSRGKRTPKEQPAVAEQDAAPAPAVAES